jgi:hypothetical protein
MPSQVETYSFDVLSAAVRLARVESRKTYVKSQLTLTLRRTC